MVQYTVTEIQNGCHSVGPIPKFNVFLPELYKVSRKSFKNCPGSHRQKERQTLMKTLPHWQQQIIQSAHMEVPLLLNRIKRQKKTINASCRHKQPVLECSNMPTYLPGLFCSNVAPMPFTVASN